MTTLLIKLPIITNMTSQSPSGRRGRPITAPGPIGELARVLGGMEVLARLVHRSRRTLLEAAKQGRWIEGEEGVRLEALCRQNGIERTPPPSLPAREAGRRKLMGIRVRPKPLESDAPPSASPKRRPGRPITAPGPIGEVARALGGMDVLAWILSYSRRGLLEAAKQERWIRDPEGKRLEALCRQNGIALREVE